MRTSGPQKPKAYVAYHEGRVIAYGSYDHVKKLRDEYEDQMSATTGKSDVPAIDILEAPDKDTPGMGGHG